MIKIEAGKYNINLENGSRIQIVNESAFNIYTNSGWKAELIDSDNNLVSDFTLYADTLKSIKRKIKIALHFRNIRRKDIK